VNRQFGGQKIVTCGYGGLPVHRSRDTAHAQLTCSLYNGKTLFFAYNMA